MGGGEAHIDAEKELKAADKSVERRRRRDGAQQEHEEAE